MGCSDGGSTSAFKREREEKKNKAGLNADTFSLQLPGRKDEIQETPSCA